MSLFVTSLLATQVMVSKIPLRNPISSLRTIPLESIRIIPLASFRTIPLESLRTIPLASLRTIPLASLRTIPLASLRTIPLLYVTHQQLPLPPTIFSLAYNNRVNSLLVRGSYFTGQYLGKRVHGKSFLYIFIICLNTRSPYLISHALICACVSGHNRIQFPFMTEFLCIDPSAKPRRKGS